MRSQQTFRHGLALVSIILAGCGGGGGGSPSAPPVSSVPPPPPVTANPAPVPTNPPVITTPPVAGVPQYTLTLAKAEAAIDEGTTAKFDLSGTPMSATGQTYLQVYLENMAHYTLFARQEPLASQANGSFSMQLSTEANAKPGSYTGTMNVVACSDAACTIRSQAMLIPYAITIYPRGLERHAAYDRPLAPLEGAAEWTTFQGNAGHTGFVPVTLDPAKFAVRYQYTAKTAAGVEIPMSEIANGKGIFYFSTGGSCCDAVEYKTYALNEGTAVTRWVFEHTNPLAPAAHAPAIAGDQIFVIGGEMGSTTVESLSATGQRSRQTVGGRRTGYFPAPTVYDGIVYTPVSNDFSVVTAFDAKTGFSVFSQGTGVTAAGWTPAVDADYYYQYASNLLYVSNRQTGQLAFTIAGPGTAPRYQPLFAPILAARDTVVGIDERKLVVFDTALRNVRWSLDGRFVRSASSDGNNLFVINNAGLALEVRNINDGTLLWTWQSVDFFTNYVSEPLVTNNLVIVSTEHATYAIDRATHATVWTYPASGNLSLSPNGTLFIKGKTKVTAIALH